MFTKADAEAYLAELEEDEHSDATVVFQRPKFTPEKGDKD